MIDEKKLVQWLAGVDSAWLTKEEAQALIRLARLGLWAEKHGIQTLKILQSDFRFRIEGSWAQEALAALPKESTDG